MSIWSTIDRAARSASPARPPWPPRLRLPGRPGRTGRVCPALPGRSGTSGNSGISGNSKLQNFSDESLIEGLIEYEKKNGWNGFIENTKLENFLNRKSDYIDINPFFPKWETVIIDEVHQKKLKVFDLNKIKLEIDLDNEFNNWLLDISFKKDSTVHLISNLQNTLSSDRPNVKAGFLVFGRLKHYSFLFESSFSNDFYNTTNRSFSVN